LSGLPHQETMTTGISNDASTSTSIADSETQRRKPEDGRSDYAKRRDANIAQNRQLLASLGLSEGGSGILGMEAKEKGYGFCLFCLSNYYYLTFLQITSG
jgi:hypothetical protein